MSYELNPFILQTAEDYSLSYSEVESIYFKYGSTPLFYTCLENLKNNR